MMSSATAGRIEPAIKRAATGKARRNVILDKLTISLPCSRVVARISSELQY
jgi:hypothetical protein